MSSNNRNYKLYGSKFKKKVREWGTEKYDRYFEGSSAQLARENLRKYCNKPLRTKPKFKG